MSPASTPAPSLCFASTALASASSPTLALPPVPPVPPVSVRSTVSGPVAAGLVGAALLASAAAIEVARAWTTPSHVLAEAGHALGGVMVALFLVSAVGVGTRTRPLGGLAVASAFALLAHGVTLVLQGQLIGGLFAGLAPSVGLLAHIAFLRAPALPEPPTSARLDIAWAIAKSNRKTAPAAPRAASPSPSAMHA